MKNEKWKYKIGSGKTPVILTFFMFAIFGGITAWLYMIDNGAFILTGAFSSILLILLIATVHRLVFYKVLIGKDGFYYQTGINNGKFYNYTEVEKAWINSGESQYRHTEDYCNIEIPDKPVIRFRFFFADSKGVNYLIKRIETSTDKEKIEEKEEYLIDGKVFGKTRVILSIVLLIILILINIALIKATKLYLFTVPGFAMAVFIPLYLINHNLFFKVKIQKDGFYCQTNMFDGQYYEYSEIIKCRKIKKVYRGGFYHRRLARTRYDFTFEFTDITGKTRKFHFEDTIHGHEINVLKERIENARE